MTTYLLLHLTISATLSADYAWLADIQPVSVVEIRVEQGKILKETNDDKK